MGTPHLSHFWSSAHLVLFFLLVPGQTENPFRKDQRVFLEVGLSTFFHSSILPASISIPCLADLGIQEDPTKESWEQ